MTDNGLDLVTGGTPRQPGHRRTDRPKRPPWGRRILVLIVVLLLLFAGYKGVSKVKAALGGPQDYAGQGTGTVLIEVTAGANGMVISNALAKAGVVKSAEAFYQLSLTDKRAQAIQPGFYNLRKHMSADAALTALVDKTNRVEGRVVVPEGARVAEIAAAIVKGSEIKREDVLAALNNAKTLGLPAAAKNNPEGYLFPATYTVEPGTTAEALLKQMVAKTRAVEKALDIDARARALGFNSEQILTVASLLEYEAKKDADYAKVARVLYNRLDQGMRLQLDSTVSYVSKRKGDVFTTDAERSNPDAYNTYQHDGLPPGPIGSPGEKTIEAALNPAQGSWLYFVAVNLNTGETIFSDTFAEHNRAIQKLNEFCKTSDSC